MIPRPVTLIVNPHSGRGRALAWEEHVVSALRQAGFVPQVVRSTSLEHVEQVAASASGPVAVLGGDGTIGRALAGALRSGVPVVPLPGGRGNDLCRALGLRGTPLEVAAGLAGATERSIDLGLVMGRPFVGVLSIGLDADASRTANTTRVPGTAAYVWGAVRALVASRPLHLRVTVDGTVTEHRAWFCSVSNSGWFGAGKHVAPHGRIDDGLLEVVVAAGISRPALVPVLLGLFTGGHVRRRGVTVLQGRTVRVEAVGGHGGEARADGEAVASLPVEVTVLPAAVRVLVPA